ncbi:TauD/TfdA family dioxygenase [Paeniroseomonas aquatica]|uniref:TauD/TfdA family dioxygenase n=1 Tax=Paeniroseomonas aquatica TaxID=373043 RepID=A0ABT8A635_9PROT|nr:TauD/TfdA family dioxygenase [Paeniroseomonas aquatica]MDN3565143.1 TauD/TfdA family dioxygenase [Paeniroseomonas aquatica]
MTTLAPVTVEVVPLSSGIGAEIRGVELSRLDDATFGAIKQAWLAHKVLRIRDQRIDDDALADFSRRFGPLDKAPITTSGKLYQPTRPEVTVISNIVMSGQAIGGLGSGESIWHTDMSYNDVPPDASVLYGIEVPEGHGDTWFCDMEQALAALPAALRERIAALRCKHDSTRNSAGELRAGFRESYTPEEQPGAVHPLVRTHPETGRKSLFLGRRRNAHIMGLPSAESQALLDELWAIVGRSEFNWVQQWKTGDLVIWDNRCVMHRRDEFDPALRRLMHRTQIQGTRPF